MSEGTERMNDMRVIFVKKKEDGSIYKEKWQCRTKKIIVLSREQRKMPLQWVKIVVFCSKIRISVKKRLLFTRFLLFFDDLLQI